MGGCFSGVVIIFVDIYVIMLMVVDSVTNFGIVVVSVYCDILLLLFGMSGDSVELLGSVCGFYFGVVVWGDYDNDCEDFNPTVTLSGNDFCTSGSITISGTNVNGSVLKYTEDGIQKEITSFPYTTNTNTTKTITLE